MPIWTSDGIAPVANSPIVALAPAATTTSELVAAVVPDARIVAYAISVASHDVGGWNARRQRNAVCLGLHSFGLRAEAINLGF